MFDSEESFGASAIAVFTYVNPCENAVVFWSPPSLLSTSVLLKSSVPVEKPYDNITGSQTALSLCGTFTHQLQIVTKPTTYDDATMKNDFYVNFDTPSISTDKPYNFYVDPKFDKEVGDYTVKHIVCLKLYPSRCLTTTTSIVKITACVITGVQKIQGKLDGQDFEDLKQISYTLQSN